MFSRARERDAQFTAFAQSYGVHLRRTAFLLCHDWHLAQDLSQTALAKTYLSWRSSGPPESPHAFCQKVLLNSFLDHRRRRTNTEVAVADVPEPSPTSLFATSLFTPSDLRITLVEALRTLPPRDRAIVVLRYWEDLPVDQVAALMDVSTAVVKSQTARSLARLRELLPIDLLDGEATRPA